MALGAGQVLRHGCVGDVGCEFVGDCAEEERHDTLQNPVPRGVSVRFRPPAPPSSSMNTR